MDRQIKVKNCVHDYSTTYLDAWKLKWFFSMLAWMISSSSRRCKLPDRFFACLRSRCSRRGCRWGRGLVGGGRCGCRRSPEHDDFEDTSSSGESLSLCSSSLCSALSIGVLTTLCCSFLRRRLPSRLSRWLRAVPSSGTTVNRTCIVLEP